MKCHSRYRALMVTSPTVDIHLARIQLMCDRTRRLEGISESDQFSPLSGRRVNRIKSAQTSAGITPGPAHKTFSFHLLAKTGESNMVQWSSSERSTISALWGKINVAEIGPQALARVLIVYPWTQRYFGKFGDLSSVAAIVGNANVAKHGRTVLQALGQAVNNMDNIKGTYAKLSQKHSEELNVDPDNFRLLGDCLTVVLATKFGAEFPPEVQAVWQKFVAVVVSALSRQYF